MFTEAILGGVAEGIVGIAWATITNRKSYPSDSKKKLTEAMRVALIYALSKTREQFPDLDEELFYGNFLRFEGKDIIARLLLGEIPTGEELAQVWIDRFPKNGIEIATKDNYIVPLCKVLLEELHIALQRTRLIQEDSVVRDLLALDVSDNIVASIEATTKEIAELRRDLVEAQAKLDEAVNQWLTSSEVQTRLLEEQLKSIRSLQFSYFKNIRDFLREYLGEKGKPVPFGGRDNVLRDLTQWLDYGSTKYLLMTANAGRGKSAVLTHWLSLLEARGHEHIIFLPISIRFETAPANVYFAILANRLLEIHGATLDERPSEFHQWRNVCQEYISKELPGKKNLLIIIDGMDEAEPSTVGNLFLHPDDLPEQVKIVLSAREYVGDTSSREWINRLNLQPHHITLQELPPLDELALVDILNKMGDPLSQLSYNHADTITELLRVTEGDPLLIRYYIEELKGLGAGVTDLNFERLKVAPAGLGEMLKRWWQAIQTRWGTRRSLLDPVFLAARNILSGAQGPILREELLRLLKPETGGVSDILLDALIPLDRFLVGDGIERGYIFSHSRFATYIWEQILTSDERKVWNQRFVDDGTQIIRNLQDTNKDLSPRQFWSFTYILQHYISHLRIADANQEYYYALISYEWSQAWVEHRGTYEGFLSDIRRVWEQARKDPNRVRSIIMQAWCVLSNSSIVSLSYNVEPELLVKSVIVDALSLPQAIELITHNKDDYKKHNAIKLLTEQIHLSPDMLYKLIEIAYSIKNHDYRTRSLISISDLLQKPQRKSLLEAIFKDILTVGYFEFDPKTIHYVLERFFQSEPEQVYRASIDCARSINTLLDLKLLTILNSLLPLTEQQVVSHEVLEALRKIKDPDQCSHLMFNFALLTPVAQRHDLLWEALQFALQITDEDTRTRALLEFSPYFPETVLFEARTNIHNTRDQARLLVKASSSLSSEQQSGVYHEALECARTLTKETDRTTILLLLAPHLPLETLAYVEQLSEDWNRFNLLEALSPHIPTQVFEKLNIIHDDVSRHSLLSTLALHVPVKVLNMALRMTNEWQKIQILCILANKLPDEVLIYARNTTDEEVRTNLLKILVPLLPNECLSEAGTIVNERYKSELLLTLTPFLPEEVLHECQYLNDRQHLAEVLIEVANNIDEDKKFQVLQLSMNASKSISDEQSHSKILSLLAPYFPQEVLQECVNLQIEDHRFNVLNSLADSIPNQILNHVTNVSNYWNRMFLLNTLSKHLPKENLKSMFVSTLNDIRIIKDEWYRNKLVGKIIPYLSTKRKKEIFDKARNHMYILKEDWIVVSFLHHFLPYFPEQIVSIFDTDDTKLKDYNLLRSAIPYITQETRRIVLQKIINRTYVLENDWELSSILSALSPYLPQDVLTYLTATNFLNRNEQALSSLVTYLKPHEREELLLKAIDTSESSIEEEIQIKILAILAPYLSKRIGDYIENIRSERGRVEVLTAILEFSPQRVLDYIQNRFSEEEHISLLVALITHLSQVERQVLFEKLDLDYSISHEWNRVSVLCAFAPYFPEKVLHDAYNFTSKVHRSKVFLTLLPHVSQTDQNKICLELLEYAPEIPDIWQLSPILIALSRYFPYEVLEHASKIWHGGERASILKHLVPIIPDAVLQVAYQFQHDEYRVRVLADLAPYMTNEVFATIPKIEFDGFRAQVVEALIPYKTKVIIESIQTLTGSSRENVLEKFTAYLINQSDKYSEDLKYILEEYIDSSITQNRQECLIDISALLPLLMEITMIHSNDLVQTLHLNEDQLSKLHGNMLQLANNRVFDRDSFIINSGLSDLMIDNALPNSSFEEFIQNFLTVVIDAGHAPDGEQYLLKLLRHLFYSEWVWQDDHRTFIESLLISSTTTNTQKSVAEGILEAIESVCSWWP